MVLGGPQPNFGRVRPEPRSALKRGVQDEGIVIAERLTKTTPEDPVKLGSSGVYILSEAVGYV